MGLVVRFQYFARTCATLCLLSLFGFVAQEAGATTSGQGGVPPAIALLSGGTGAWIPEEPGHTTYSTPVQVVPEFGTVSLMDKEAFEALGVDGRTYPGGLERLILDHFAYVIPTSHAQQSESKFKTWFSTRYHDIASKKVWERGAKDPLGDGRLGVSGKITFEHEGRQKTLYVSVKGIGATPLVSKDPDHSDGKMRLTEGVHAFVLGQVAKLQGEYFPQDVAVIYLPKANGQPQALSVRAGPQLRVAHLAEFESEAETKEQRYEEYKTVFSAALIEEMGLPADTRITKELVYDFLERLARNMAEGVARLTDQNVMHGSPTLGNMTLSGVFTDLVTMIHLPDWQPNMPMNANADKGDAVLSRQKDAVMTYLSRIVQGMPDGEPFPSRRVVAKTQEGNDVSERTLKIADLRRVFNEQYETDLARHTLHRMGLSVEEIHALTGAEEERKVDQREVEQRKEGNQLRKFAQAFAALKDASAGSKVNIDGREIVPAVFSMRRILPELAKLLASGRNSEAIKTEIQTLFFGEGRWVSEVPRKSWFSKKPKPPVAAKLSDSERVKLSALVGTLADSLISMRATLELKLPDPGGKRKARWIHGANESNRFVRMAYSDFFNQYERPIIEATLRGERPEHITAMAFKAAKAIAQPRLLPMSSGRTLYPHAGSTIVYSSVKGTADWIEALPGADRVTSQGETPALRAYLIMAESQRVPRERRFLSPGVVDGPLFEQVITEYILKMARRDAILFDSDPKAAADRTSQVNALLDLFVRDKSLGGVRMIPFLVSQLKDVYRYERENRIVDLMLLRHGLQIEDIAKVTRESRNELFDRVSELRRVQTKPKAGAGEAMPAYDMHQVSRVAPKWISVAQPKPSLAEADEILRKAFPDNLLGRNWEAARVVGPGRIFGRLGRFKEAGESDLRDREVQEKVRHEGQDVPVDVVQQKYFAVLNEIVKEVSLERGKAESPEAMREVANRMARDAERFHPPNEEGLERIFDQTAHLTPAWQERRLSEEMVVDLKTHRGGGGKPEATGEHPDFVGTARQAEEAQKKGLVRTHSTDKL